MQNPIRPPRSRRTWTRRLGRSGPLVALTLLAACGGSGGDDAGNPPPKTALACDDSMKTAFKPDADTQVVLVKAYKRGEALALANTTGTPPTAAADLCLVKMIVGPGSQDAPAGAPSISPGIGIEVWLPSPAQWNKRIRNLGGGGWAGGNHTSTTLIGSTQAASIAGAGFVSGTTDTGHSGPGGGSFAMRQDGSINTALWTDFAERSLHELAVKTKRLVQDYYLEEERFAYWEGCSTGGRQGYKLVQNHPDDYDGYLNGAPAFNWTKFITNELYPQVVMQRDLGGVLAPAKLNAVSAAAVDACGTVNGQPLGFILDPAQCRYDPTRDAAVLCAGTTGNGGVVGTNSTAACVNLAEASAVNKIWYGQTADGSVPAPALDNASTATLAPNQLWWGLTRGSNLTALAGANPFTISSDMVALELQDPRYATPSFVNATGNGMNRWRDMTYADLANAFYQGVALQPFFGHINTDEADLRAARDKGVKVLSYHGLADTLITPAGSVNYFTRVSNVLGGFSETNKFNKLYLVPAMGHCSGVGSVSGTTGPAANANTVPLPATDQFFNALMAWVENSTAPGSITLNSANASVSMPICPYPQRPVHDGSGSVTAAASYSCR